MLSEPGERLVLCCCIVSCSVIFLGDCCWWQSSSKLTPAQLLALNLHEPRRSTFLFSRNIRVAVENWEVGWRDAAWVPSWFLQQQGNSSPAVELFLNSRLHATGVLRVLTLFLTLAFRFSPGALPCGACTTFIPWKTGHSNGQDPAWFWRDSQNHDGELSGRFHARSWLWLLYKVCWKVYFSSILGGHAFLSCFLRQKVKNTWSIKVTRTSLSIMSSFVLIPGLYFAFF